MTEISEVKNYSRLIRKILAASMEKQQAVAIYRLPFSNKTILITGEPVVFRQYSDLDPSVPGFVIYPFDPVTSEEKPVFIKADSIIDLSLIEENKITLSENKLNLPSLQPVNPEDDYKQKVISAKEKIATETVKKIVLARKKEFVFKDNIDLWKLFESASVRFPEAFISLVALPEGKIWLGATPELLASQDQDIFRTMALAGTRKHIENIPLEQTEWKQKEIEEQALVSRYIINCFKSIRLREFEEDGPKTVRAGSLLHLRTEFWVNQGEVQFPYLLKKMVDLLHPTSAVCGMPSDEAMNFIRENENIDREFYSGYLGPVHIENQSFLFVNLRCARIFNNYARVYAGAGITAYSDPESEWQETELKINVLGDLLNS